MSPGDEHVASTVGGRPAVGNVLGFSMLISGGEVLLRLPARALGSGVRLHDYEAAVAGVKLPLSGELSAQAYRQFRCRVRRMTLQIDRRAAEGWLCRRLLDTDCAGLRISRATLHFSTHLDPSGEAIVCLILEGRVAGSATWVALPLSLVAERHRVGVKTGPAWVLGPRPLDSEALAQAIATRLFPAHRGAISLDPVRGLITPRFVSAGWKVPDCSVGITAVSRHPQSLELHYGEPIDATTVTSTIRTRGRVDTVLDAVRQAQQAGDIPELITKLEALTEALVHHDEARVAALRWLADVSRIHDPARCLTALRVWLHITPHDRAAIRLFIALAANHDVGRELARRLTAACRFPNPDRMQARLELALANVLVDKLNDPAAARAMIDPLAERLEQGMVDAELTADIWTCVAKAHADEPRRVEHAIARALRGTERAAERASVEFAAAGALAGAGHTEAAERLLESAVKLAPDEPEVAAALRSVIEQNKPVPAPPVVKSVAPLPIDAPPESTDGTRVGEASQHAEADATPQPHVDATPLVSPEPRPPDLGPAAVPTEPPSPASDDPAPDDPAPDAPAPDAPAPDDPAPDDPAPDDPAPDDPAHDDPAHDDPAHDDPAPDDPTPAPALEAEPPPTLIAADVPVVRRFTDSGTLLAAVPDAAPSPDEDAPQPLVRPALGTGPSLAVVGPSEASPPNPPPATPPAATPTAPAPSALDAMRRAAWEALETRGDLHEALRLLHEALTHHPTDALLLSALKSMAADNPELYLQALEHALQAVDNAEERDRWALEFAMAATEIEDVGRVTSALAELSPEAADTLEAATLREWAIEHEAPQDGDEPDSLQELVILDDAAEPTGSGLDDAFDEPAVEPQAPDPIDEGPDDDESHLAAIERLLHMDPPTEDLTRLFVLGTSISPQEGSVRALDALATAVPTGAPQRAPLAEALLSHAAAIDEPWIAVAALRQASAAELSEGTLLAAWPRLQRTIIGRGDSAAAADMVEICRATPALAPSADQLRDGCLAAFPESNRLHAALRADLVDALPDAHDGQAAAVDALVQIHLEHLADVNGLDAADRARLFAGAAAEMAGPPGAAMLASRAETEDWRGPAFVVLMDALQRAGHWAEVIALHERRAESSTTASEQLDARKRLGHICAEVLGDTPAAIAHLEAALALAPRDPDLLLPLLDHHFGQRDLSRAVVLTARVLDYVRMGDAAFASLAHRAADAAIAMGDPVTAAELLSRVVGRNAGDTKAATRLTEIELMAGDPQRRIELLGAVADRQVGRARLEALEERARLLLAEERPEAAIDDLATVCRESPQRDEAALRLAALYRTLGRTAALIALQEARVERQHGAEKIPALLELAQLYADDKGDLGRAEAALRIGLEHAARPTDDPTRATLEDRLVENLSQQGRFADLASWLQAWLERNPEAETDSHVARQRYVHVLTQLAAVYGGQLGDDDAAATLYRELEARGALPDDGLAALARWYRRERRYEDLVRILGLRAASLAQAGNDERRALIERWIAELLEGPLGRPQDAAAHYLEAYLADRDNADTNGTRARVLLSGTDSIVNVRAMLLQRLDNLAPPRHPALLVLLADLLGPHEGYEAEAEACYRRALSGDQDLATAHEGLGRLLFRLDRAEEAARSLIAAVRSDGLSANRSADAAALAARALSDQGRSAQAESVLRLALARMPDSQRALLELVAVHDKAGRRAEQAEALETLAALPLSGPRHADVAFQRAMLLRDDFHAFPRGSGGERARSLLLEAVSADARHAAARQTLIDLAGAREEWSIVAHMHYLTIRELPPGPERAASHLDLAEVYLDHLGDALSCMRNIDSALQQASDDIVVATRTTALAHRMQDPQAAASHFEQLAGGDNELDETARARLWLLAADLRMDEEPASHNDDALADLAGQLDRAQPHEAVALLSKIRVKQSWSEGTTPSTPEPAAEQARQQARRLAEDTAVHQDLDAAGQLRELLAARGDYAEAVDLSRVLASRTAQANPTRAAHWLTEAAGFAWHALHEPVHAAELLAEALALHPESEAASTSLDELARAHQASDHARAMSDVLAGHTTEPTPPAIGLAKATLLRARGDDAAALSELRPLLALDSSTATPVGTQLGALRLASILFANRGNRPARLDVLTRAVTLSLAHEPDRVGDTSTELTRLHRELGDNASARRECERGLAAAPKHRGLLAAYAELLEHDGEWGPLVGVQTTLAKLALSDDEQAMWLTRAAKVMMAHASASPDPSAARRLLIRACAVAADQPEPRTTLLPLSFSESRWRETLDLADELHRIADDPDGVGDSMVVAALAEAYHTGARIIADRVPVVDDDNLERWLLPGLRHVLQEVATRGPLPRLDDILSAAVRMSGGRQRLLDAMTHWALRRPLNAGTGLGLGRLLEAEGAAVQARHHYQVAAFLAPEGAVPGLVTRLPTSAPKAVADNELTGGGAVRATLLSLRESMGGLPWSEVFATSAPRRADRPLVEQLEVALAPMREALGIALPIAWVQAGPPLGIGARVCAVVVSPAIGQLPWPERVFRLALAATDVAMGLAVIAPPGPSLAVLLAALAQHLRPGYEAKHDDARTIAEALRMGGAPRDPLGRGRRASLLDELAHHATNPTALAGEISRRRDLLATLLCGRVDGALMAVARDTRLRGPQAANRTVVIQSERAQWLLRALVLR